MTKPKGIHATFQTECWACDTELNVTNGRIEPHDCRPQIIQELDDIQFPDNN